MKKQNAAKTVALIRELSRELISAHDNNNLKAMQRYGKQLIEPLRDAYYSNPGLLKEPEIRVANNLVRKLKRAQYIETPKKHRVFSGGLPSLGKRR